MNKSQSKYDILFKNSIKILNKFSNYLSQDYVKIQTGQERKLLMITITHVLPPIIPKQYRKVLKTKNPSDK